ncbi:acyltransferase family protein [Lactovum miscens]|uniref:Peptidoglycan/LPS O-acetylase OafA/YrhL n=1 Tax=Lactovum miscens TaxID=190387 RepID=A0A841C9A4_9LACT|nr:acyltransferase family protein [Lactovum miscens]MBB5887790.1 peptidoglycan/LPS O-acetylase OafA/YrhL [Lactovum miscens]
MIKHSIPNIIVEENTPKHRKIRHFGYIRTLGLLLVLVYHFYPTILPGGFIGVDIFFTFSGYLITSLILSEVRESRKFSIKKFAERRFFRIFPTVFFGILITLPLTLFGTADLRFQLKQQVFAALSFISNIFEASTGTSYENNFAPHLYVHLWSLAIEVQFYIVWGLFLWLLVKYSQKSLNSKVFFISIVITLFSSVSMIISSLSTKNFSALYYSPFFHIFPFFFGATLATLAGTDSSKFLTNFTKKHRLAGVRNLAFVSGFLLILLACLLHYDWQITFTLGFVLASVLSVLLIFSLRVIHEMTEAKEIGIIKGISDISYGVYILHWAFLVIFLNLRINHLLAVIITLFLSFSLSALMFYILDPFLRKQLRLSIFGKTAFVALTLFLLFPSVLSLIRSSGATSLTAALWQGTAAQASQNLYLAESLVETGKAGVNILVIGDSVANGTRVPFSNAPNLEKFIPGSYADTAGDRKISSDLRADLINDMKNLPENTSIVIALGTNSIVPAIDIQILKDTIKEYSGKHHLVLVTPANFSVGGPFNSDKIADWEISIKGKYKNVSIADWRTVAQNHPEYYDPDGVHISDRPAGRAAWLSLVKNALAEK